MTFKQVVDVAMEDIYKVLGDKGVRKLTKSEEEKVCAAPFDAVIKLTGESSVGDSIRTPIGSFRKYVRGSYPMFNPHTGSDIVVPEKVKVRFRVSKKFKDNIK